MSEAPPRPYRAPVIVPLVRQHVEQAAFLWTQYDAVLARPEEFPDMDEERLARLVERLDAHLDGVRVAGEEGVRLAEEAYEDFPYAGELFVLRMLQPGANGKSVADLDIEKVRAYLEAALDPRG
ncbi:hypothetical protein [Jannaschia seohaensis]|uniref:Uncharacterized protein n=1 Tax=Jannaschia seohaensis TaxID=475081 RepID=A0A2Y9B1J3_9RHOB|nr:hypothetical protein [Jannaschia seohaensis]PWJ16570.1 hypothetical protein BCF38_10884 [Jannaschia seohaensis]SSA48807.1 hypothetical protein SAMN05421539_10884 [Jannaschia seohaensis]